MPTLGVNELQLATGNFEGECIICPERIISQEQSVRLTGGKQEILIHDFCFAHFVFLIQEHIEEHGLHIPDDLLREVN